MTGALAAILDPKVTAEDEDTHTLRTVGSRDRSLGYQRTLDCLPVRHPLCERRINHSLAEATVILGFSVK